MGVVTARYTFSGAGEDFGPRKGRFLVILHTFENADPTKNTLRDAVAGAIWQDRNDTLGSYNRLVAVDGVLGCVPDNHASGGVNPASPYFKPRAWLYGLLPANVVNDPNAYALQLCAMGRRDWYDANGWPPAIIDGFARSIIEEEQAAGRGMVVANHADFQPGNRTDAGAIAMDLVMKRYAELTATPEDDVDLSTFTPIINRRVILADGATPRYTPAFDRTNYDANAVLDTDGSVIREKAGRSRVAVGWVNGTNLTLANGTVLNPSVKWLLTNSDTKGGIFYHEQDVADFEVIETVETGPTQADIDAAVAAALAAFNKNLDVWTGTRPKS
jgi:hypothetical protein